MVFIAFFRFHGTQMPGTTESFSENLLTGKTLSESERGLQEESRSIFAADWDAPGAETGAPSFDLRFLLAGKRACVLNLSVPLSRLSRRSSRGDPPSRGRYGGQGRYSFPT
jgi:hypothetical protein